MCVIALSGRIGCFGSNQKAEITTNPTSWVTEPVLMGGVLQNAAVQTMAGYASLMSPGHACVVADGRLACWGSNSNGEFMNGFWTYALSPPAWTGVDPLANATIKDVGTAYASTCALTANDEVFCAGWGKEVFGVAVMGVQAQPVAVDWGAMAGGGYSTMAMSPAYLVGVWSGVARPGLPPSIPSNVLAGVAGSHHVNLSWNVPLDAGASAVNGYTVEASTDGGRTWPLSFDVVGAVSSTQVTVPRDDYYMFRVAAKSATGSSIMSGPSPEVLVKTLAPLPRASVPVVLKTPSGRPIVGAPISWKTTDGLISSVGSRTTDATGTAIMPVVETGPVTFTVTGGAVGSTGVTFTATFTTVVQPTGATIQVVTPDEPEIVSRTLTVKMPDGSPIPDAALSVNGGGVDSSTVSGFTTNMRSFKASWGYPAAVIPKTSGATGTVTFHGFAVAPTGQDVTAVFKDDFISQTAFGTLDSPTNTVTFQQMPVVRMLTTEPSPLDPGASTTITVQAVDGFGNPIASAPLSLAVPTVKSAILRPMSVDRGITTRASCAAKLTGSTGADGKVTFRICPSATASWRADGSSMVASKPLTVRVKPAPTQVSAGAAHTCARLANGTASCWGLNSSGQLGTGRTVSSPSPVAVPGLTGVTSVAAGAAFSCALQSGGSSGKVKCWGANSSGQLGDGSVTGRTSPVQVTTAGTTALSGVTAISAGSVAACAVVSGGASGTARCWGGNGAGQLGDGTVTRRTRPVVVKLNSTTPLKGVTQVSVGTASACAVLGNGAVRCWGANSYGQLGRNSTAGSRYAVPVTGIDGVANKATSIAVGDGFACARLSTGAVRCWGRNDAGQLGNGGRAASKVPVAVKTSSLAALAGASRVTAGGGHACAVTGSASTARVRCWGLNNNGQLGDGTTVSKRFAVLLASSAVTGVKAVSAGGLHTEAVVPSTVRTPSVAAGWGRNASGQLGLGNTVRRTSPTTLSKL
jgi:alpha-tubulin suppressor-like RCC1 family protein